MGKRGDPSLLHYPVSHSQLFIVQKFNDIIRRAFLLIISVDTGTVYRLESPPDCEAIIYAVITVKYCMAREDK
jgi:hypothetical protein